VPDSADFVMFWWQHAASLVCAGQAERFGFITTNSLRQTFNRRVVEAALNRHSRAGGNPEPSSNKGLNPSQIDELDSRIRGNDGLHLAFAIPDHPWVDSADGAAVRIAMTVGVAGEGEGRLLSVTAERETGGEGLEVELSERVGLIHADLSIGANVAAAKALRANGGVANRGVQLLASGFVVKAEEVMQLDAGSLAKRYRNGKDLTDRPRNVSVLDTYGYEQDELRKMFPSVWQWLHDRAKPERDQNPRSSYRENWWLFGENQPAMRATLVGLSRYIATPVTAKHRVFQYLETNILPDQALICIALDDAYALGVLSSRVHVVWALATGGRLGVGNDPRYNKTRCFETFPFPELPSPQPSPACGGGGHASRIAALAEQLDALRKRVLAEHPNLTLTGLYNVLEKERTGAALTPKEIDIHQRGLVGVLRSLHDELDAEVLAAYGWDDLLPPPQAGEGRAARDLADVVGRPRRLAGSSIREGGFEATLLTRLVALNTQRSAEEAAGNVRWLRPEFQNPGNFRHSRAGGNPVQQSDLGLNADLPDDLDSRLRGITRDLASVVGSPSRLASSCINDGAAKLPWPASLPEQVAAVARVLAASPIPLSEAAIAARFSGKGAWKKRLPPLLETLVALGRARLVEDAYVSELY
jgi:hypothetical protein